MKKDHLLMISCLTAALGLAGCQQEGAAEKAGKKIDRAAENAGKKIEGAKESVKESVSEKAETAGEYVDDSVITLKVKTAISSDPMLKSSHIEVTTVNGMVKLSGTVASKQSISRAVELANGQKHVKSVQTDLMLDPGQ